MFRCDFDVIESLKNLEKFRELNTAYGEKVSAQAGKRISVEWWKMEPAGGSRGGVGAAWSAAVRQGDLPFRERWWAVAGCANNFFFFFEFSVI